MRRPEYLSPSAISRFVKDVESYYLYYLSDHPTPREPQTKPMAVGSAFDAFAKSYLHAALFGRGSDARFELAAIFETQVEAAQRDWAMLHGARVFEFYKDCGALGGLLEEMKLGSGARFEFELRGAVGSSAIVAGPPTMVGGGEMAAIIGESTVRKRAGARSTDYGDVVLLGKPDVAFVNRDGVHVIYDWKVNGYCSAYATSPMKGYLNIRDGRKLGVAHKECVFGYARGGTRINVGTTLDLLNEDWARQLAIYSWLAGEGVGGDFVVGIDQVVCKPMRGRGANPNDYPDLRVAEHRLRISPSFQHATYDLATEIWGIVNSDHVFRHMSKAESAERCALLDRMNAEYYNDDSEEGRLYRMLTEG